MFQSPIKDGSKPIVITGFGSISGPARDPNTAPPDPNLSEEIMKIFYSNLDGKFVYNSEEISILTGPGPQTEPIPCCYDKIEPFDTWLRSTCTDARVYVHLGTTNGDQTIYFEKVAYNSPVDPRTCHPIRWVADYDSHFIENECISGGDRYLTTSFNIPVLIEKVAEATRGKINPTAVSFQESYNAGNFLCNFLYYRSLYYTKERGNANVIFIHVPEVLPQGVEIDGMVFIIEQVVRCLLDMQTEGGIEDKDASQFICPANNHFNSDEHSNQSETSNELRTTKKRQPNVTRKWQYQKLTRKQARSAHRRRKRKWKLRQRIHIK